MSLINVWGAFVAYSFASAAINSLRMTHHSFGAGTFVHNTDGNAADRKRQIDFTRQKTTTECARSVVKVFFRGKNLCWLLTGGESKWFCRTKIDKTKRDKSCESFFFSAAPSEAESLNPTFVAKQKVITLFSRCYRLPFSFSSAKLFNPASVSMAETCNAPLHQFCMSVYRSTSCIFSFRIALMWRTLPSRWFRPGLQIKLEINYRYNL